ncbi:hypothetical protein N5K55_13305 [Pseudomonas aeruginosa]|nr:hypothetical protein [Pseudomonas aeruginosa]
MDAEKLISNLRREHRATWDTHFPDNPLDEYLPKIFQLKIDEFNANCTREDATATKEERDAAGVEIANLSTKIRELKK